MRHSRRGEEEQSKSDSEAACRESSGQVETYVAQPHQTVISALLVTLLAVTAVVSRTYVSGDSVATIDGAGALRKCLSNGLDLGCSGTNQFGFPQYLLSIIANQRWGDSSQTLGVLAWTNGAAVIAYLVGLRRLYLSGAISGFLFLSLVISPAIIYGASTFSEMLVLTAIVFWVYGLAINHLPMTIIGGIVTFSSRESILFMVGPLVLYILVVVDRERRFRIAVSVAAGTSLMFAFNLIKFGSINNPIYSDPSLRTTEYSDILSSLLGLIASPSGGLLFNWPLSILAISLFLGRGLTRLRPRSQDRPTRIMMAVVPPAAILASVALQLGTLALWFAPFGWVSWGPRTLLPGLTLTILLAGVFGAKDRLHRGLRSIELPRSGQHEQTRRLSPKHFGLAAIATFGAWPLIGFLIGGPVLVGSFVAPREPCIETPMIQVDRDYYFMCLGEATWRWDGSQTQLSTHSVGATGTMILFAVFILSLMTLRGAKVARHR